MATIFVRQGGAEVPIYVRLYWADGCYTSSVALQPGEDIEVGGSDVICQLYVECSSLEGDADVVFKLTGATHADVEVFGHTFVQGNREAFFELVPYE